MMQNTMNVNGIRFDMLLSVDDWLTDESIEMWNVEWDSTRHALRLSDEIYRFRTPKSDNPTRSEDRADAGRDASGNTYWIGPDEQSILCAAPANLHTTGVYWTIANWQERAQTTPQPDSDFEPQIEDAASPESFRGLAVTTEQYMVVGTLAEPGLLVFDLYAGGPPIRIVWPSEQAFHPFLIMPTNDGGVWILDRDPLVEETPGRLWRLDRYFRIVSPDTTIELAEAPETDFQPYEGDAALIHTAGQVIPGSTLDAFAVPLTDVVLPVDMVVLPDDSLLLLDSPAGEDSSVVWWQGRIRRDRVALALTFDPDTPSADDDNVSYAFAFVPDADQGLNAMTGTLYVVSLSGNQSFEFGVEASDEGLALVVRTRYLPMRRYTGLGLVSDGQSAYYHTKQDRWLKIVAQQRPRYKSAGDYLSRVFDSGWHDCVWHRLDIDACIPTETMVMVESRTANELSRLEQQAWQPEPRVYRRQSGPEVPFYELADDAESGVGTWELLFQSAVGRFIQLRLRLVGNGRRTPRLSVLRVHYPRFSYLRRYLPDAYQLDPESADFLDRYLANTEGLLTTLEGTIAHVQRIVDVDSAPSDYLDWLASWLGLLLDEEWSVAKRRFFLRNAPQWFRQRGTLVGLIRAVRFTLDECVDETLFDDAALLKQVGYAVRIIDEFLLRRAPAVVYGDPSNTVGIAASRAGESFTPTQGAGAFEQLFVDFLKEVYGGKIEALNERWQTVYTSFDVIRFPSLLPEDEMVAEDWLAFTQSRLDFVYSSAEADDADLYRQYLYERYRTIEALNLAYQTNHAEFGNVPLPQPYLPGNIQAFSDWIQFVSLYLPIHERAHRFSVMLPFAPGTAQDEVNRLVERVRMVLELEKPAHTVFTIKPYWLAFRVDEARLGYDTVLLQGTRFTEIIIGLSVLPNGYLAPAHPFQARDRFISDRYPNFLGESGA